MHKALNSKADKIKRMFHSTKHQHIKKKKKDRKS